MNIRKKIAALFIAVASVFAVVAPVSASQITTTGATSCDASVVLAYGDRICIDKTGNGGGPIIYVYANGGTTYTSASSVLVPTNGWRTTKGVTNNEMSVPFPGFIDINFMGKSSATLSLHQSSTNGTNSVGPTPYTGPIDRYVAGNPYATDAQWWATVVAAYNDSTVEFFIVD